MKNLSITTYADGFGRWRAKISFPHTLSESDPRLEFNLGAQWDSLRRKARTAIVNEIAVREQTTSETLTEATRRVRRSLPPLKVIEQGLDAQNRWHSVTFGE